MKYSVYARMLEHLRRLASALRIMQARATGVHLGYSCRLERACDLSLGYAPPRQGRIELGDACHLDAGAILHPYGGVISLERNVYVGPGTAIYGHGGVCIGQDSLLSMHCRILSSNHTLAPIGTPIRSQPDVRLPTIIGRDVWLGAGVTVLGGVTIGDGCVIGAGSVVTKDLPPGSIAVGVPAKVTSHRQGATLPGTSPAHQ